MDFDPGTDTQPPTGPLVILIFISYIIYSKKQLFNHFKTTKNSPFAFLHDSAGAAGDPSEASKQFRPTVEAV
jgi:hypothetical protein